MSTRTASHSLRALRLLAPDLHVARLSRRNLHSRVAGPSRGVSAALVCLAAGAGISAALAISRTTVRADAPAPAPALAQPADGQIEVRCVAATIADSAAGIAARVRKHSLASITRRPATRPDRPRHPGRVILARPSLRAPLLSRRADRAGCRPIRRPVCAASHSRVASAQSADTRTSARVGS